MLPSSPLPAHLYGTYKQYKHETDEIATWLARNAIKARRNAGIAGGSAIISVDDFVNLATEIAASPDPSIYAPTAIIESIRSVLRSRQKCAQWFGLNAKTRDHRQSNDNHVHFIAILEETLRILLPLQRKPAVALPYAHFKHCNSTPRTKKSQNYTYPASYRLQAAETVLADQNHSIIAKTDLPSNKAVVEKYQEPSVETVHDEDDTRGCSTSKTEDCSGLNSEDTQEYQANITCDNKDLLFNCFCLVEDLNNIRKYIQEIWAKYRDGKILLVEAALVTNFALDLTRELHISFDQSLGTEGNDFMSIFMFFFYSLACKSYGVEFDLSTPGAIDLEPHMNNQMQEMREWMFLPAWLLVRLNLQILRTRHIPDASAKLDFTFNTTTKHEWRSSETGFVSDTDFVPQKSDFLAELFMSAYFPDPQQCIFEPHDNYLQAIPCIGKCKCTTSSGGGMWTSFATQVMIDIHSILGAYGLAKAATDPLRSILDAKNKLKHCLQLYGNHGSQRIGDTPEADSLKSIVEEKIQHLTEAHRYLSHDGPKRWLARNPIAAGLWCFELQYDMYSYGSCFCDITDVGLTSAHVYNAARHEDVQTKPWPDMDYIISTLSAEYLFKGDLPNTDSDYATRLMIARGHNVATRRSQKALASHRRCFNNAQLFACAELSRRALLSSSHPGEQDRHNVRNLKFVLSASRTSEQNRQRIRQYLQNQLTFTELQQFIKNVSDLAPLACLQQLSARLRDEMYILHFDFAQFASNCLQLTSRFQTAMDFQVAQLAKETGRIDLHTESPLERVLTEMLYAHDFQCCKQIAKHVHKTSRIPLAVFVEVYNQLVTKWGTTCIDKLKTVLSDFVPSILHFSIDSKTKRIAGMSTPRQPVRSSDDIHPNREDFNAMNANRGKALKCPKAQLLSTDEKEAMMRLAAQTKTLRVRQKEDTQHTAGEGGPVSAAVQSTWSLRLMVKR